MRAWFAVRASVYTANPQILRAYGPLQHQNVASSSSFAARVISDAGQTLQDGMKGWQKDAAPGDVRVPVSGPQRSVNARRLLRAILRECTYLPDSFAREWMRQHVLQRFRTYTLKAWEHRDDPGFEARLQSKHHEARQAANQLRRANEGERKPLLKVLLLAYGRTGKRRHELMQPLLPNAGREVTQVLGEAETVTSWAGTEIASPESKGVTAPSAFGSVNPGAKEVNKGARLPYVPELTPQLRALLQSQTKNPPPHLTRATLRKTEPRIEERNSWLRPMPRVRVKNMTKQWYAELLDRVHVPLPTAEWERLRGLAIGELTESLIPRRKAVEASDRSTLAMIVMYGKPDARKLFGNRSAHHITPRYMQRLWAQVFTQCPRMDWDIEAKSWKVTWGEHAMHDMPSASRTKSVVDPDLNEEAEGC